MSRQTLWNKSKCTLPSALEVSCISCSLGVSTMIPAIAFRLGVRRAGASEMDGVVSLWSWPFLQRETIITHWPLFCAAGFGSGGSPTDNPLCGLNKSSNFQYYGCIGCSFIVIETGVANSLPGCQSYSGVWSHICLLLVGFCNQVYKHLGTHFILVEGLSSCYPKLAGM